MHQADAERRHALHQLRLRLQACGVSFDPQGARLSPGNVSLPSADACRLPPGNALAAGLGREDRHVSDAFGWLMLFVYYFANYFVIVFCNSALVACAMIRFKGGSPSVADGWRAALGGNHQESPGASPSSATPASAW